MQFKNNCTHNSQIALGELLDCYWYNYSRITLKFTSCNYLTVMHLSIVSPIIPPGALDGELTTPVINYSTLWAGEVIKSPPMTLVPHRGSCGDLIIKISKYFLFRKFKDKVKFPSLGASLSLKTEENSPTFPTCSPRGDSRANN